MKILLRSIGIRIIIGFFISLIIYLLKISSMHNFSDLLFLISLVLFIVSGFQFVINQGLFNFQKYSFKRIGKVFSSWTNNLFFLNNSSHFTDDDNNEITSDYMEFLEKERKNLKGFGKKTTVNIVAALFLSIIAIVLS